MAIVANSGTCPACGHSFLIPEKVDKITTLDCPHCGSTIDLGKKVETTTIRHGGNTYEITGKYGQVGVYYKYDALLDQRGFKKPYVVMVVINPIDNVIGKKEAKILEHLKQGKAYEDYKRFIPSLIDAFPIISRKGIERWCNVFEEPSDWYSLEQVKEKYPRGLHPKTLAWIFRKILIAIGFAHINDILHCAVVPSNIFVNFELHGLVLWNWQYAIGPERKCEKIQSIDPKFEDFYPKGIIENIPPVTGLDVCMSKRCMQYVMRDDSPIEIKNFLEDQHDNQITDVWEVFDSFTILIEKLWGPRKFFKQETMKGV